MDVYKRFSKAIHTVMKFRKAETANNLEFFVGETIKFESLRQPIVPPYLMLIPYIETPKGIIVESQYALDEDGYHGCIYQLKFEQICKSQIIIGFRDMITGKITHRKEIPVIIH